MGPCNWPTAMQTLLPRTMYSLLCMYIVRAAYRHPGNLAPRCPCHDADCVRYQDQRSPPCVSLTSLRDRSGCPGISDDSQPGYSVHCKYTPGDLWPVNTAQSRTPTLIGQIVQPTSPVSSVSGRLANTSGARQG